MAWILANDNRTLIWNGPGPAPYVPPQDQNALRAQIKAAGGAPQPGPASQQAGVVSPRPEAKPIPLDQYQQQASAARAAGGTPIGQTKNPFTKTGGSDVLTSLLNQVSPEQLSAWYQAFDPSKAGDVQRILKEGVAGLSQQSQDSLIGALQALTGESATNPITPKSLGLPTPSDKIGFSWADFFNPFSNNSPFNPINASVDPLGIGAALGFIQGRPMEPLDVIGAPQLAGPLGHLFDPRDAQGDPVQTTKTGQPAGSGGIAGSGLPSDFGTGVGGFGGELGGGGGGGGGAGGAGGQNLISPQFGATGQTIDWALASHALSGFNLPSRIPRSEPGNPTVFNPFVGHERDAANYPLSPNTSQLLHQGNLFGPQALDPTQQQLAMLGSQYIQGVPYGYGAQAAMQQGSPGFNAAALLPFGNSAYAPLPGSGAAPTGYAPVTASDGSQVSYQATGAAPTTPQLSTELPQAPAALANKPLPGQPGFNPQDWGGQFGGPVIQRGATPGYAGTGALAYNEAGLLTNPAALQLAGGNNSPSAGGLGVGLGTGPGAVNQFMGAPGFGGNPLTGKATNSPWGPTSPMPSLGGIGK